MARVQVSEEVWAAYRASLGATPVSVALGELVRREVGRAARRSAKDADGARLALEDARALSDELAALIARLEQAAGSGAVPSPNVEPASHLERPHWRLDPSAAASAYSFCIPYEPALVAASIEDSTLGSPTSTIQCEPRVAPGCPALA